MTSISISPFYKTFIGFDNNSSLIDNDDNYRNHSIGYPYYNIEKLSDKEYAITLAVAGFRADEIEIVLEGNLLTVVGKRNEEKESQTFIYQGITYPDFETKYSLADCVRVISADLQDGILKINLKKEIPESLKPIKVAINQKDELKKN